ncbi:MAG: PQQ-binding-like beta-propeller repeat protein [Lentisphaeria bacterium]|nr:PQQ-binding-like beta-propeller repeat protein [Lentisphaeria bacterium]
MKKLCFFIAAAAVLSAAAQVRHGSVFFDANGNGVQDKGEAGIANVAVSDGVSITRTGRDGRFSFTPAAKARHVFISVPEGYRANGKFYRTMPEKLSFPLVKWQRPRRFVQISDGEIHVVRPWMNTVKEELAKNPADFVIYTGDIAANTPDGMVFAAKYFTFKRMGVPIRFTIGNHDFTKGKSGDDAYMTNLGPMWYSFDSNGVHFVVVPMIWDGTGQRKDKPVTYKPEDFSRWVRKDLELLPPGKPVIFFGHDSVFDNDTVRATVQPEKFNIKAFIHGHWHECSIYRLAGITHYVASSVKDGFPFAAMGIYEFDRDGNVWRFPKLMYTKFSPAERSPQLKWSVTGKNTNFIMADPVVCGDTVYTGSSDLYQGKYQRISAFDRKSGKLKWEFTPRYSVMGRMAAKDGKLMFCDHEGYVYALDKNNGKLLWENRISDGGGVGYNQGAVIYKDKLIAGFCNHLKAFSIADGKVVWHCKSKSGKLASGGAANIIAGNTVIGGDGGRRSGVDGDTGKLLWQGGVFNFATPVYGEGKLFATINREICRVDVRTGKILQRYPGIVTHWNGRYTPLIADGKLYTGSLTSGVAAMDIASGKLLWRFLPQSSRAKIAEWLQPGVYGSLILDKKRLFCGAMDGKVYALDPKSGVELWHFDAGDPISGIALDKDELFVTDHRGTLYKLDVSGITVQ